MRLFFGTEIIVLMKSKSNKSMCVDLDEFEQRKEAQDEA